MPVCANIAVAVVIVFSAYLGGFTVLGIRHLIVACRRAQRRRHVEYVQLVTTYPDGATTTVINLDHYRCRRRQHPNHPNGYTDPTGPDSDESA